MGTLANSEDPTEMPHNAAFHQGLHYLQRQNQSCMQNKMELGARNPVFGGYGRTKAQTSMCICTG